MESDLKKKKFDPREELKKALEREDIVSYLSHTKIMVRHEAWFLISCLTNLILIDEIKELNETMKKKRGK